MTEPSLDLTSAITSDPHSRLIWLRLVDLVRDVTHKAVSGKGPYPAPYEQSISHIAVPWGDIEALTHELCHWAVATPQERALPNLGLDKKDKHSLREQQCWDLEVKVFEPICSEAELHATLSPMSQRDHEHFWHSDRPSGWYGARDLPITHLRSILAAWWRWRQEHEAERDSVAPHQCYMCGVELADSQCDWRVKIWDADSVSAPLGELHLCADCAHLLVRLVERTRAVGLAAAVAAVVS